MNSLENRIERLENRVGGKEEILPLIVIYVTDCSKESRDRGIPKFGIIPGRLRGPQGTTLIRNANEAPDDFLKRCDTKYAESYT